jgi:hypothetical protein
MYVQAHKAQRVTTCVSCCRGSSYRAKAARALARTAPSLLCVTGSIVPRHLFSVAGANCLPRYRLRYVVADVSAEALGLRLQGQSERRKHPARRIAFD